MAIETIEFDLSLKSPDTGEYLTARTYTVDGVNTVDGLPRQLSIGQLVMALCLQRAAALEEQIIATMEEMNNTSIQLELMTEIETAVLAGNVSMSTTPPSPSVTYNGTTYNYFNFLTQVAGMAESDVPTGTANASSSAFITALEANMDEKNSFSQRKMIDLQSQTSKRDQAYDMVSNILKSLNTVLVGIANNT